MIGNQYAECDAFFGNGFWQPGYLCIKKESPIGVKFIQRKNILLRKVEIRVSLIFVAHCKNCLFWFIDKSVWLDHIASSLNKA